MTQYLHKLLPQAAVHQPQTPLVDIRDLSLRYDGRWALDGISFQIRGGERIAVVGPNGAGKSTLFKVIAGVLTPTSGSVAIAGGGPSRHICIAYVQQRAQVDWGFPVSVADVVMMGRIRQLGLLRWPRPADWELAHQALGVVGLAGLAQRQIGELSGGQQQRMFIARALAQEAELMLLDEPLTGLDTPSQEAIFDILDELKARHVTVLVAMHDLRLAAEQFDQVMLLNRRLIGFGLPEQVFTPGHLAEAYGGHLHQFGPGDDLLALSDTCCEEGS
ncbi:MAG TPA: metal ABC transporter ATP-binding protein [Anaerolineales bacterium]|jgi:manganese/iron transport system ATP-binding protein|nr:metal ABC transporter ATP-binding protein [Anaerolineales bacterium]